MECIKNDIVNVSNYRLEELLRNSTITEETNYTVYNRCKWLIDNGDVLDKEELYYLLMMNARDIFHELPVISNTAISKQLDRVEYEGEKIL